MQIVQLTLLVLFALCSALSFLMRVRMGILDSAITHGIQPEERKPEVDRYYSYACRFAIAAAAVLVLCVAVGALRSLLGG